MRGKGKGTDIKTLQKPLPLTRGTGVLQGFGDLVFTKIVIPILQMSTVLSSVSFLIPILHYKMHIYYAYM
jgi:hypothetical protein